MHFSRGVCKLRSYGLTGEIRRLFSSAAPVKKLVESAPETQVTAQEKFDFEDLKVLERVQRRKPKIEPFMKNVYLTDFNRELLAYPEILNKDEYTVLQDRVKKLDAILNNEELTENEKFNSIKNTEIFGAPINLTKGGFDMIMTERLKYLETLSADPEFASRISDHWVVAEAAKIGLPEKELDSILPDIFKCDEPMTLCINEKIATKIEQEDFQTKSVLFDDGYWHINGEKFCANRNTHKLVLSLDENKKFKILFVKKDAPGVTYGVDTAKFVDTPGLILNQARVEDFNLSLSRLDTCVISYSVLKRLVLKVEHYVRGKFISNNPLADLPLVRTRVAEAMLAVYTAQSMAYFTAGLMDGYESPDAQLEMAMCRVFITERSVQCAVNLLNIVGAESLQEEWSQYLHQLRKLQQRHDQLDTLNVFIGLLALEHVGKNLQKAIRQIRNPLFNPSYVVKKIFEDRHQAKDDPKLYLHLEELLHPSLRNHADKLEYAVMRLKYGSEQVLAQYGNDVYLEHNDLERLAQAGTEVFAMTAVLARASRAYCIGLQNSENEMLYAAAGAEASRRRVQKLVLDIDNGQYMNMDTFAKTMGRRALDGGVANVTVSPIERVWW